MHIREHTISGFWGCSGAMIAIPGKDTDSCKVIGLCKFWLGVLSKLVLIRLVRGDATLIHNDFLALSPKGIEHLQNVTDTALGITNLPNFVSNMDINNPDSRMAGSPFAQQTASLSVPSEAAGSNLARRVPVSQESSTSDNDGNHGTVICAAKASEGGEETGHQID